MKWELYLLFMVLLFGTYEVFTRFGCSEDVDVTTLFFKENLMLKLLQLKAIKLDNANLKQLLNGLKVAGPSDQYENLRRRIYSNTKELWYYISNLRELTRDNLTMEHKQNLLQEIALRKRSLLSDQEKLPTLDGFEEWRRKEANSFSDHVQRRLHSQQNPPDCRIAKKLICAYNVNCDFSCQLHQLVYCFIIALATQRTVVLDSAGEDSARKGWQAVLQPFSGTCTKDNAYDQEISKTVDAYDRDAKVIILSELALDIISKAKPKFLRLAIPDNLVNRIVRFNGDLFSWWVGQMIKYMLKPKGHFQALLNYSVHKMDIKSPRVGVHVQRKVITGTEVEYHDIEEYMHHVDEYYAQLEMTRAVDERRVYLATDDAQVLENARRNYPQYKFYGDSYTAKMMESRNSIVPLTDLLVDLVMLARSNYIVCTFSSLICQVAYEMMQTNHVDATDLFFSLDGVFHYLQHDREAIIANKGVHRDISFNIGDTIDVAGNYWNGYGRGTNKRTNMSGPFPWYKTVYNFGMKKRTSEESTLEYISI